MPRFVRIGDRVFNLKYVSVIEARTDDPGHVGGASIKVNTGQPYYFEGPDADSVRGLIETFPRHPSDGGPGGEEAAGVGYSAGPRAVPDRIGQLP